MALTALRSCHLHQLTALVTKCSTASPALLQFHARHKSTAHSTARNNRKKAKAIQKAKDKKKAKGPLPFKDSELPRTAALDSGDISDALARDAGYYYLNLAAPTNEPKISHEAAAADAFDTTSAASSTAQNAFSQQTTGKEGPAKLPCRRCNKVFNNQFRLDQHIKFDHNNEIHECPFCNDASATWTRLARHIFYSHPPSAPPTANTPLDLYFQAYPEFTYRRTSVPSDAFNKLRHWKGPRLANERAKYGSALRAELAFWFGGPEVHAVHRLYRALGIKDPPFSLQDFTRNMRNAEVNLIDLLHWARHEGADPPPGPVTWAYQDRDMLREYARVSGRFFPSEYVEAMGDGLDGSYVVQVLLRSAARKPVAVPDDTTRKPVALPDDTTREPVELPDDTTREPVELLDDTTDLQSKW